MKRIIVTGLSVAAAIIIVFIAAFTYKTKYCKTVTFFFDGRKAKATTDHYEIQKLKGGMENLCEFDDEKRIFEIFQSYKSVHDLSNPDKYDETIRELVRSPKLLCCKFNIEVLQMH